MTPNIPPKPILLLLPEAPDSHGESRAALLLPHVPPGRQLRLGAFPSIAAVLATMRDLEAGQ